ncbi:hypothetical protein CHUAL_010932 [Chamberlinius hualienensis]
MKVYLIYIFMSLLRKMMTYNFAQLIRQYPQSLPLTSVLLRDDDDDDCVIVNFEDVSDTKPDVIFCHSKKALGSEETPIIFGSPTGNNSSRISPTPKRMCNQHHFSTVKIKTSVSSIKNEHNFIINHLNLPESNAYSYPFSILRPIAIDGSNIAYGHGHSTAFSSKGIKICVEYFLRRGHKEVKVFVPRFRLHGGRDTLNREILHELEQQQIVVFTPSRKVDGKLIVSYDDRFVLDYASQTGAVVVSNDNYRDLIMEPQFSDVIKKRLLQYSFAGDIFMVPHDPLGRSGPTLDNFLMF